MNKEKSFYLPEISVFELEKTLLAFKANYPKGGMYALLPESEKENISLLQRTCRSLEVPLIGAVVPALVKNDSFCRSGLWLLGLETFPYYFLVDAFPLQRDAVEKTVEKIADQISAKLNEDDENTLFMVFDSMIPNITTILDHLYLLLANNVHYAGVNVGSETFQPMPCVFDSEREIGNGALFVLLPKHKGAILEHGYHAPRQVVYATSTANNLISQIDWRPAFDVYQELVFQQYGVSINRENFYEHSVHFPFGIVRANQQIIVRIPVMLNEDGAIFCVGEVPDNSVLTLLERPAVDTHETMRVITEGLDELYQDNTGADLQLYYCSGRKMHLGPDGSCNELKEFMRLTGASQVAGGLSLGEIGNSSLDGYPLFHNATLVALRF